MSVEQELLENLQEIKEDNLLVIVEGIKDKKALEKLGIKRIVTLKKPLYKVIEEVEDREIVLLTDLDKEGKLLYRRLNHEFSQRGIKINNTLRNFLFKKTKLAHIEGLAAYLDNLK